MTIQDLNKVINILKINSEFIIQINGKNSTLYDLQNLKETTKIKCIQIEVIQNNLNKEDIGVYTLYESNIDIELPLKCKYDSIIFNVILK